MQHVVLILFYISTKYHQNIPKGIRVTEWTQNLFQIKQRVVTSKVRKPELSVLYATHHLVLIYIIYILTKYHQNIPKVIQVTEQTRSFTLALTPTGSVPKTMSPSTHFGNYGIRQILLLRVGLFEKRTNFFSSELP